jgi:hypothetical protein
MGNNASQSPLQSDDCLIELMNDHTHPVLVIGVDGCESFSGRVAPTRRIRFYAANSTHVATIRARCEVCGDTATRYCNPGEKLRASDVVHRWNTLTDTFEVLNEHCHPVNVSTPVARVITVGGVGKRDSGDGTVCLMVGERAEFQHLTSVDHATITISCTLASCPFCETRSCTLGRCLAVQ